MSTDAVIAKLRYMAQQYTAGSHARGGNPGKHYLDQAADELEALRAQRDELLVALLPFTTEEGGDLQDVLRARAATAKAEGGAA